jgi:hypothetical protein
MALTKAMQIESISDQIGFPKNQSSEIVETLLEINSIAIPSYI